MRLGLGTVQFGQDYGISNRHGRPAVDEVAAILRVAADGGVDLLDTAHAYGDAEEILGELAVETAPFRVVTKTPAARVSAIGDAEVGRVRGGFSDSLARLQRTSLFGLLLHRAADLALPGGERLAETLVRLREEGKVAKVGVSVYSPADLDRVIRVFRPDLVQLPFSVLEARAESFIENTSCSLLVATRTRWRRAGAASTRAATAESARRSALPEDQEYTEPARLKPVGC